MRGTLHLPTMDTPMTVIKVTCTKCGNTTVTPDDVTVVISNGNRHGRYVFEHCGVWIRRLADHRTVEVLRAVGCDVVTGLPGLSVISQIRQKYILEAFAAWLTEVDTIADMEASLHDT